jgi:predicted ribosome quality control (RQC) complex YloA/Tae2 family protein
MATPLAVPFDRFVLAAVAAELQHTIVGGRVQKISQPSPTDIVLACFGAGGARRLLISTDPQNPRLHLTQVRRENPTQPLGFCQVARKYLEGLRLDEVALPYPDRVLRLAFSAANGDQALLIAELMGRNANLILLGGDGIVRGVLRPIAADSPRPLRPGVPYTDPPGVCDGAPGRFAEAEGALRDGGVAALVDEETHGRFAPHTVTDDEGHTIGVWAFAPLTAPPGNRHPIESIGVALDTFHALRAERHAGVGLRQTLEKTLAKELAFKTKALTDTRRTLAEASRADHYEQSGNLLLAHLAAVEKGQSQLVVTDLYSESGAERTIALDPKKSPRENADAYFERARKTRDAAAYAEGREADLEADLEALRVLKVRLDAAETDDELDAIKAALAAQVPLHAGTRHPGTAPTAGPRFDGHKVRTVTIDAWTLYIGENAEANDYLLKRVAGPADLWMHIRGATGAHGVLKTDNHPERVPDSVLRRAAALVAGRSAYGKHEERAEVDVTQRKYVRKPRGGKPGQALYERARTITVEPQTR